MKTIRLRRLVDYVVSGPSPTCEDRAVEGADEWGVLKTTAVQWDGWNGNEHKLLPPEYWGARHLEVRDGDVLITKAGPRHRVGVSAYVNRGIPRVIVSGKMILIRVKSAVVEPRFLNWKLSTPGPQAYLNACKTGMAEAQMNFANEDLLAMSIDLPPIAEQRRIADLLDARTARIDRLVDAQFSLLRNLDARDVAVRDQLVERLLEKTGELPMRRYTLGIEQGASPQCDSRSREADEWGVLKLSAVKAGTFYPDENKHLPDAIPSVRRWEVHDGDLLISRANTPDLVGDVAVVKGGVRRLLLPDLLYRVALDGRLDPEFVAHVLLSTRVRGLVKSSARGSSMSMAKIRGEDIRSWPIPCATREQQEYLVASADERLHASSQLRKVVAQQLSLLAERRRALVTAAVTGQIDVATAGADA